MNSILRRENRQHTSRKSIPGNATQGEGLRAHTQNPLLVPTLPRVPTQTSGRKLRPRTVILGEGGATTTQVVTQVASITAQTQQGTGTHHTCRQQQQRRR